MSKKTKPEYVYVLRTCTDEMLAHNGFKWPESGPVECKDWDPKPKCGHGLHGLLWAEGDGTLLNWSDTAKWLVAKVLKSEVVVIDAGKVKFPRGTVVFCGKCDDAIAHIKSLMPDEILDRVYGGNGASGVKGQASASGDYGQASASGYQGQASASGDAEFAKAHGMVRGGLKSALVLEYYDKSKRLRLVVAHPGEKGIEPDTWYELSRKHEFVKCKEQ